MFTYKFKFSNNNRGANQFKNLDAAQEMAVKYMENYSNVNECEITTQSGALSIIRKDGSWHWNHNGYSFSHVPAEQVKAYRELQHIN
jgi:hypothetical protein